MFNLAEQRRRSSVGLVLGALLGAASQVSAAPLLGLAGDSLMVPSPTAYHPEPAATTQPLAERDLAKTATDPHLYQWKREPSLKFIEGMKAKQSLKRRSSDTTLLDKRRKRGSSSCLAKGSTQTDINKLFSDGGAGTKVVLCAGTTYELTDTIIFTAANQQLYTQGYPTDDTRAALKVTGDEQSVAIWAGCDQCSGVVIRNVEVDGNRPALGRLDSGAALIEAGGNDGSQTISYSHIHNPRGWSAMHIGEGYGNACSGFSALGNDIGPSGESPNSAYQFHTQLSNFKEFLADPSARLRKRDDGSVVTPGQWADGISLSCADATIRGNTVTDTTDGGIVIFGSPGSLIRGNTIVSKTQVGLGGINLVDWNPWNGNYKDVTISGNVLSTEGAMIKIGIAMGPLVWGSYNNSEYYNIGASVKNNNFISGDGYFGYGIAAAAHTSATTSSNRFTNARFNMAPTYACFSDYMPPAAAPMVRDPYTTQGQFQKTTAEETLLFLICIMPCEYSDDGCTWDSGSSSSSKLRALDASNDAEAVKAATNVVVSAGKVEAAAAEFIDDRPPYTYDSDKALSKNDSEVIAHEDEPFQLTTNKVAVLQARLNAEKAAEAALLSKRNAAQMFPGRGRNVYEKRDLVQDQFLAV